MKVGLVIPWRPQPTRVYAFEATMNRYSDQLPGVTAYYGDTDDEIFNPSGARNKGCLEAIADGCDVLVVSDADLFVEPYPLHKSIEKAASENVISIPYIDLLFLSKMESDEIIAGREDVHSLAKKPGITIFRGQVGGIFVLSESTFRILNGWDERFQGWGFEDLAIREAHKAIFNRDLHRTYGIAVSLNHEDRDKSLLEDNESRFKEYQSLGLSREEMIEHVKGNRK
jgi:predicted glycosyltransferase involved in capsule biosynthesis